MFNPFDHEDEALESAIAQAYDDLKSFSANEDDYRKAAEQITKLYNIKNEIAQINLKAQQSFAEHSLQTRKTETELALAIEEAEQKVEANNQPFWKSVDMNTALTVAGNLAVALIVVKYEQTGVIGTKVTSFMRKF